MAKDWKNKAKDWKNKAKDWKNKAKDRLQQENTRSDEFTQSNDEVNNPTAPQPKSRRKSDKALLKRSRKVMYFRADYQQKFDELAAKTKHTEGKNGPELIEEAIELLLRKYQKSK